ncbi:RNB-domain-containing protein [Pleurostoma richardsiae]|uniref:RNB-domain-containing protein n=1 Tax=Pleurostoma richardsiae TaxID=41990 RepID=A0AA38RTZ6_9PEZI|nr:RNB-domain-containing protein [Pleurostoma richardsiae]
MLKSSSNSYICWRCLNRKTSALFGQFRPRTHGSLAAPFSTKQRLLATVNRPDELRPKSHDASAQDWSVTRTGRPLDIRERLRQWEKEHAEQAITAPKDYSPPGALRNTFTRSEAPNLVEIDEDAERDNQPLFDGDDLVDLRSDTAVVHAGDLIEVLSDSWRVRLLAICLGRFNGLNHFYTNTGKWFTSHAVQTLFTVHNFVEPSELQPVINALPSKDAPIEVLNVMQELGQGPSRDVGAGLIARMQRFALQADAIHQANAARLDNAHSFLGKEEKYLNLHEIAEALLPARLNIQGRFAPEALYAVHRTLMRDDVAFRPLSPLGHRRSYLFEISSQVDVMIAERLENMVRAFFEDPERLLGPLNDNKLKKSTLGSFILRAREAIDRSRKSRNWSHYGLLSPAGETDTSPQRPWTVADTQILHFMELWAAHGKFSNSSRLHWVGSAILRAVEKYESAEYLDSTMGWVFLQELGWISPCDIQSRYRLRLPGIPPARLGGLQRPLLDSEQNLLGPDILAEQRVDCSLRAYCIDSASATDIDDAISIEPTSKLGEHWIHVHIADPASRIQADTPLADRAELVPQTAYLPGHFERMFDHESVRSTFSLAPDRPCLTFSALVNEDGAILDSKITPGRLHDVIYITGKEVNQLCGDETLLMNLDQAQAFEVGKPASTEYPPNRKMTTAGQLPQQDVQALQTLSRLANAIQNIRLARGAMPLYWPRPSTQVSFEHVEIEEDRDGFLTCVDDPFIRVSYEGNTSTPVVDSTMRLAGEIAARWCSSRGIPVPFRTQPDAARNLALLQSFTQNDLYPCLAAGKRPTETQWRTMRALLGADEISAEPGLHFTMGVDMYTKATSPLRRYSDLLVHWQIEAALLEESRRGASLVGNTDESFLPFTKEHLEQSVLPMLRMRERTMRTLDNRDGNNEWILQALVRAWRFGDLSPGSPAPLPSRFRFAVQTVLGRRAVRGRLDWFDQTAVMAPEGLNAMGVTMTDIKVGDVFEVELEDVNVPARQITVRAMGRAD